MKDLTPLEKEFFKILSGNDYNPDEGDDFTQTVVITAKVVAVLCEKKIKEKEHEKNQQIDNIIKKRKKQESEKIKRAIELARETHNSLFIAEEDLIYTPEEILELLNQNK